MKKRNLQLICATGLIVAALLSSMFIKNTDNISLNSGRAVGDKHSKPIGYSNTGSTTDVTGEDINNSLVQKFKSKPITQMPWDNDENFKKALEASGAKVLLAGYMTVLKDPLPGEEENVHLGARMLAGKILAPGQVFSQNETIGPYIERRGYKKGPTYIGGKLTTTIGGGVCKIASTLYNVAIQSNLQIVERHNHSMPVPYVPYGQDATVSYGNRDMKFSNNTSAPVMIWAQGIDNILYMAFYGVEVPPKIEWKHEILNVIKAQRIYKQNPLLPSGSEKIILEGMDGAVVKSAILVNYPDGRIEMKNLGLSNYKPFDYIVERN